MRQLSALDAQFLNFETETNVANVGGLATLESGVLWEMYLIHGLAGDRCAIYGKLHHAAIDGLTGARLLVALMDSAPPCLADEPDEAPNLCHMLARSTGHLAVGPLHALRFLGEAVPVLDQIPVVSRWPWAGRLSRLVRGGSLPDLPDFAAPHTPLSGLVSAHRNYAFVSLPLEEIKRIKEAFGVKVNDVVIAPAASALRAQAVSHVAGE